MANDSEISEYETIPQRYRAARYDGLNNAVIESLMTGECTLAQLVGTRPALLLKRPGQPETVIQVGDWVYVDEHLSVGVSGGYAFARRCRRAEARMS